MKASINLFLMLFSVATAKCLNNKLNYLSEENNFNCKTYKCIVMNRIFEQLLSESIEKDADPCEDFHKFVCRNLKLDYPDKILSERPSDLNINEFSSNFSTLMDVIHNLTNSCQTWNLEVQMNTSEIEKKKVDELKKIISELGGWPVLEGSNWDHTKFDWTEFNIKSENSGIYLFPFLNIEGVQQKNWKIVQNIQSPYNQSHIDYLFHANFTNYKQYYSNFMKEVAKFMGATSQQTEELNESFEFETKLISATKSDNLSRKFSPNDLMSVKEIKAKWPGIDWTKFFSSRPRSYFYATNQTKMLVQSPGYITNLEKLVRETPKRVLANFAIWTMIEFILPLVGSTTLINIFENYVKLSIDPLYKAEYQLKCHELFDQLVGVLKLPLYLFQNPIDKQEIALTNQIISDTKKKMIEIFTGSNKFDMNAKNEIVESFNSLNVVVGQTDTVLNPVKFKEYIRELKTTNDSLLQNFMNLHIFIRSKYFEDSTKPKNSIDLTDIILQYNFIVPNAHYFKSFHALRPLYLQETWISNHLPNYVNYATIGVTIAHELGHSVDFIKRHENIFGDIENEWSTATITEYEKTEACLIEQFNNYTFQAFNQTLNGTQYLLENIADLIGAKVAYSTYQDFVQKHGVEAPYFSLPYSPNQLFWISLANYYCILMSTDMSFLSSSHAPHDKRISAMVSNSPEFARDFNCPLKSKMNPQKKCNLF